MERVVKPRLKHSKVNLRKTHPFLYRVIMTLALISICGAINLWKFTPTFKPYRIDTHLIGSLFFLLGLSKVVFLNFIRDLRLIRISLAASFAFVLFWGIANTQQGFAGKASFAIPVLYGGISVLHWLALIEAPVNPTTEKK